MNHYIQVITTIDKRDVAEQIATSVIERKLAACVQISNCLSMYRWKGEVERSDEFVCVMKSRKDLFPELEKAIRSVHTYEVPEIIATDITSCDSDYQAWLEKELCTKKDG